MTAIAYKTAAKTTIITSKNTKFMLRKGVPCHMKIEKTTAKKPSIMLQIMRPILTFFFKD